MSLIGKVEELNEMVLLVVLELMMVIVEFLEVAEWGVSSLLAKGTRDS